MAGSQGDQEKNGGEKSEYGHHEPKNVRISTIAMESFLFFSGKRGGTRCRFCQQRAADQRKKEKENSMSQRKEVNDLIHQ